MWTAGAPRGSLGTHPTACSPLLYSGNISSGAAHWHNCLIFGHVYAKTKLLHRYSCRGIKRV